MNTEAFAARCRAAAANTTRTVTVAGKTYQVSFDGAGAVRTISVVVMRNGVDCGRVIWSTMSGKIQGPTAAVVAGAARTAISVEQNDQAAGELAADQVQAAVEAGAAAIGATVAELEATLARVTTSFASFGGLLTALGGYRPSIRLDIHGDDGVRLADAYDAAQAARGDDRRAFRSGDLPQPPKPTSFGELNDRTPAWQRERTPGWADQAQVIYMTSTGADYCRETAPVAMTTHDQAAGWARAQFARTADRHAKAAVTGFRIEWWHTDAAATDARRLAAETARLTALRDQGQREAAEAVQAAPEPAAATHAAPEPRKAARRAQAARTTGTGGVKRGPVFEPDAPIAGPTPGPWIARTEGDLVSVRSAAGLPLAIVGGPIDQAERDGRLIAAAPRLARSLAALLPHLPDVWSEPGAGMFDRVQEARAALVDAGLVPARPDAEPAAAPELRTVDVRVPGVDRPARVWIRPDGVGTGAAWVLPEGTPLSPYRRDIIDPHGNLAEAIRIAERQAGGKPELRASCEAVLKHTGPVRVALQLQVDNASPAAGRRRSLDQGTFCDAIGQLGGALNNGSEAELARAARVLVQLFPIATAALERQVGVAAEHVRANWKNASARFHEAARDLAAALGEGGR